MYIYEYMIFSSDFSEEYTVNRLEKLGIPYKQIVGCYKGVMEISYIVSYRYRFDIEDMFKCQESILLLSERDARSRREAFLDFGVPGMEEYLGKMHSVGHSYAIQQDAWSYDPETDKYFVAERIA